MCVFKLIHGGINAAAHGTAADPLANVLLMKELLYVCAVAQIWGKKVNFVYTT